MMGFPEQRMRGWWDDYEIRSSEEWQEYNRLSCDCGDDHLPDEDDFDGLNLAWPWPRAMHAKFGEE